MPSPPTISSFRCPHGNRTVSGSAANGVTAMALCSVGAAARGRSGCTRGATSKRRSSPGWPRGTTVPSATTPTPQSPPAASLARKHQSAARAPAMAVRAGRVGGRGAGAGGGRVTGALLIGAVVGELFPPWLMSDWSSSRLLVGGQLMTAVPSLVYVVPDASAALMLAAASARGLGMGVAIVVSVVLVGEVAAPERRGRSIGSFGLALSEPSIVGPSPGVALLEAGHVEVDALVAFGFCLVRALLGLRLPRAAAPMPGASTHLLPP